MGLVPLESLEILRSIGASSSAPAAVVTFCGFKTPGKRLDRRHNVTTGHLMLFQAAQMERMRITPKAIDSEESGACGQCLAGIRAVLRRVTSVRRFRQFSSHSNAFCLLLFWISICSGVYAFTPSTPSPHRVVANRTNHLTAQIPSPIAKVVPKQESGKLAEKETERWNSTVIPVPIKKPNRGHLSSNLTELRFATSNRHYKPINAFGSSASQAYQWPSSFYSRDAPLYPQSKWT